MKPLRLVTLTGILCLLLASPASAGLPDGYEVIVTGATLDARAIPPVVTLPTGAASTIGLDVSMKLVRHDANDWLVHDTAAGTTRVVKPAAFHPSSTTASVYDPATRAMRSARVVPRGGSGGPTLSVAGGPAQPMDDVLLAATGTMIVFETPEPGVLQGLVAGVVLLRLLERRRRS